MLFDFVLRVVLSSILVLQVLGQNSNQTFGWKFREDFFSERLTACFSLRLVVFPKDAAAGNFSGVPPYYMMAFPQGGQPITTLVGVDNDTLSWAPSHPVGTKLILQMVDSTGNTGGTSGQVFQIVENPQTNTCTAPQPPSDFTVTSNITQDGKATLETCHPWRLNINGGIPPYRFVLDARNSPVITNITVPAGDDALIFINRADPGTVLFAGVVDATGRWATNTQFVNTVGSTNYSCIGFGTRTTTQALLNELEAQANEASRSRRRTSVIIGVVVTLIVLLLIAGGVGTWLYLRKKRAREGLEGGQDTTPRQFTDAGSAGQILSINQFIAPSASTNSPSPRKSAFSPGAQTLSYGSTGEPYYNESMSGDTSRFSGSSDTGANLRNRPSFANFPTSSVRRSAKAMEAAQEPGMSELDGALVTRNQSQVPSGSSAHPMWPERSGSLQATATDRDNEIIYQHQDAGQVVRELPPPYAAPPDTPPANNERST